MWSCSSWWCIDLIYWWNTDVQLVFVKITWLRSTCVSIYYQNLSVVIIVVKFSHFQFSPLNHGENYNQTCPNALFNGGRFKLVIMKMRALCLMGGEIQGCHYEDESTLSTGGDSSLLWRWLVYWGRFKLVILKVRAPCPLTWGYNF